ncbi:hypothetical protein CPB83DRAFT_775102 [Crepidotus variabilis]|uniref:Uncharacterized protein n=1 Tax=Crepidotus variabilis TaxID=179855 RepID=A0A9P6E6U8_9AGAR|nr:hypothetical protein CPB83DRAFT_775102 [Crepidotus variabilis]
MTDRRSKIEHVLMEMLQMLKFSFKQGRGIDFSAGTSEADIEAYLLARESGSIHVAEDVHSYLRRLLTEICE